MSTYSTKITIVTKIFFVNFWTICDSIRTAPIADPNHDQNVGGNHNLDNNDIEVTKEIGNGSWKILSNWAEKNPVK